MRPFIFLILLSLCQPAFAVDKTPAVITAKKPKASPAAKIKSSDGSEDDRAAIKWIDVEPSTRNAIVTSWLQLDETTRPPFPSYFSQWMKNGTPPAANAKTEKDEQIPKAKAGDTAPSSR